MMKSMLSSLRSHRIPPVAPSLLLTLALLSHSASADVKYCASLNTASNDSTSSIYQSNGLCTNTCKDNFAFAIVQGQNCWCSNYVPAQSTQADVSDCNESCPGYPDDKCGGDGLFGYIALDKSPSGTLGASATSTASPAQSTSSSNDVESATATEAPKLSTVTKDGTIKTVFLTPTQVADNTHLATSAASDAGGSGSLTPGAAAGIAIGVISAIALIMLGIAFFFIQRRRKAEAEEEMYDNVLSSHRRSSSGMLKSNSRRTYMSERYTNDEASTVHDWDGRRRSTLMPLDPRMKALSGSTAGLYGREYNKSRDTIVSLRDDQDYSRPVMDAPRVLRATNPDPDG